MSRIKQKKQGVINSLVWTQQDNSTATLSYDGTDFDFDAPVTVAGALSSSSTGLKADTISEYTSGSGVTVDGVKLKDSAIFSKVSVTEIAATVLTAADSGKVFFVNSDSGAAAFTLPAPAAGLHFKWIVTANCTTALTITTADTTDTTGDMLRGCIFLHSTDNDTTVVEASGDVNKLTLDDDLANSTCGLGSWIEVICTEDPVWFITGMLNGTTDTDGTGAALFSDVD